jgi:molecular chaperone HtpG
MTAALAARAIARKPEPVAIDLDQIAIGKDILELVSSAMYVDPMTVYREYIQNAADAVDLARQSGILAPDAPATVHVEFDTDANARTIRIRDNGAGLGWADFVPRLTALGGSAKRGTGARGFRGVGRLAGLGYAQELIFRSRAEGETLVSELRWDGRKLRAGLREANDFGVPELIQQAVSVNRYEDAERPQRFFEVEMVGVPRQRGDRLMSPPVVAEYLAQVAPVPFSPEFKFGAALRHRLATHVDLADLQIYVAGEGPIYRPHRDQIPTGNGQFDTCVDVEITELPGGPDGPAAIAWVVHHSYEGAFPNAALVKGLRLRVGDIQVGDHDLFEDLFPELRFNAWAIGEVHVLDPRIIPNGRRDNFEQSTHYANLRNHVAPIAREIGSRCRSSSVRRKWLREFTLQRQLAEEKIGVIVQGGVGAGDREQIAATCDGVINRMRKIAGMRVLADDAPDELRATADQIRDKLANLVGSEVAEQSPLARLAPEKREMYEHLFGLVYECSVNRIAAKALIDRILLKIAH